MIRTELSAFVGILFVLAAGANVWLMFQRMSPGRIGPRAARLTQAHRALGYLYLTLYLIMMYFMIVRLQDAPDELAPRALIHMILGLTLAPLLFLKILIARTFRNQSQYLTPLGLILFSLSFILVGMTAGPYLLRRATMTTISLQAVGLRSERVDLRQAEELMRARCARCHNLERVVGARKDTQGWLETVNRMRALPGSGISEAEGRTILSYLVKALGVDSSQPAGRQLVGRALVDARCGRCHTLDKVYSAVKTPTQWKETIDRMVTLAPPGHFQPGEPAQILAFLSSRPVAQAGATVATGPAGGGGRADGASVGGPGPLTTPGAGGTSAAAARSDRTAWLVVLGAVVLSALLYWRGTAPAGAGGAALPTAGREAPPTPAEPGDSGVLLPRGGRGVAPATVSPSLEPAGNALPAPAHAAGGGTSRRPLELTLARIIPETPTAKTFRFLLPPGVDVTHQAGQFLTFEWQLDGQKVVRSYSISSSPSQSRQHLDITVKRVPDGRVSGYLHDHAAPGLTVTARPPAGRFVLGAPPPPRLLCLAAGSGLTPVMSILRWIDDACLPVEATLIYSVRTADEILFGRELERLAEMLPGFRLVVTLTQPDAAWTGASGRLSREMIAQHCPELADAMVYLCGPKPFMEAARALLAECGVPPERVRVELFGGPPAARAEPAVETVAAAPRVTFARSGKSVPIPTGCTLLETAEMNGIALPYSCRQGQCGTCATRLLAGEVRMDAEDGLDPELRRQGYILTCVGRAPGDVTLDA
jgi:ferredoxin-NADP reductase